jgi:hypothetical protein
MSLFSSYSGSAQFVDLDLVGFAGPHDNWLSNGPDFQQHLTGLTGPKSDSWSGSTDLHDASTIGVQTQGVLQYNINGGHVAVYEHAFAEQTVDATSYGYVLLSTMIHTQDAVTITGLPKGTPVNVNIVFALGGDMSGEWNGTVMRGFAVHSTTWGDAARLTETQETIVPGSFAYTYSVTASMAAGYSYDVFSEIGFSTHVLGSIAGPTFSTLDASHSSNVRFYPEGAGTGVTSLSGFDYTTAVPEPASMAIVAGLCVFVGGGRIYLRRRGATGRVG